MDSIIEKVRSLSLRHRAETGLVIISATALVASGILFFRSTISDIPMEIVGCENQNGNNQDATITVDISGAVVNPDIYTLKTGTRLQTLIAQAGGLSENADQQYAERTFNFAARLKDEQKIYVPYQEEILLSPENAESNDKGISINTATQKELETLNGIGEVTAQKIITNRPYQSLDELRSKSVLGESTYNKIKDSLTL